MAVVQSAQNPCFFQTQNPINITHHRKPRNLQTHLQISNKSQDFSTTLQLFEEIPHSNTFAWNNLIQKHLSNGNFQHVMLIYPEMLIRGLLPDKHTLPRIVSAARLSGNLFYGKQIHGQALKFGFGSDQYVITALMEMYGRCDGTKAARRLFDQSSTKNSVSWTLLAGLYIIGNKPNLAVETFNQMVQSGVEIDAVALATVIGACGRLKSLQEGRKVHKVAKKCGLEFDVLVGNSLLKMYLDCGSLKEARMVFDQMQRKDAISWTTMLRWYVKNGEFNEGLKLFRSMNSDGEKPDSFSVSGILPACARISALKHGKEIHAYTIRNGVDSNLAVQNALMDMYMKSGFPPSASKLFLRMREKDTISLTIMILGYSLHGQGELGVELFHRMEKNMNTKLDDMAYTAVLHACNTARMVEEGKSYFKCIRAPKVEHYSLMVSLLARVGLFDEARAFIEERRIEWNIEVQRVLISGCRIHRDKKMGKRLVERLIEMEPLNADNYVLLSNLYAAYGKWDAVDELREMIIDMGLRPKRGYSWIEVRNKIHVFGVGDVSHPRSEMIYSELQGLMQKMKEEGGYVPDMDFSLHDVDEERECIPIGHSEMLAISFGLISTQKDITIRITKNLRVCRNCHSSAKIISKILGREIVLKDPDRFHHFRDGFCSCGDFW